MLFPSTDGSNNFSGTLQTEIIIRPYFD
jgi:hypothetical protein